MGGVDWGWIGGGLVGVVPRARNWWRAAAFELRGLGRKLWCMAWVGQIGRIGGSSLLHILCLLLIDLLMENNRWDNRWDNWLHQKHWVGGKMLCTEVGEGIGGAGPGRKGGGRAG